MEVPNFFSDKEKIFNFDYSSIRDLIQSEIDHSTIIENLSVPISLLEDISGNIGFE